MSGSSGGNQTGTYGSKGTASSNNIPGGRGAYNSSSNYSSGSWKDINGDFWLFGGYGKPTSGEGFLNDLWKYDNPAAAKLTVKTDGTGHYTVIQTAINATSHGDTVLVYPGTYTENINFNGKKIVVGSLYLTTSDTSYISSTIIDGNNSGTVVTFDSGESSTAVLKGFTLTNGSGSMEANQYKGGGIYIYYADPLLRFHLFL